MWGEGASGGRELRCPPLPHPHVLSLTLQGKLATPGPVPLPQFFPRPSHPGVILIFDPSCSVDAAPPPYHSPYFS